LALERRDLSFKRILIVFSRPPPERVAAAARFGRLAFLLSEAGYEAFLEPADSIACLSAAIASFAPDIVFSAADHLPAGLPAWDEGAPGLSRSINVHSWLEDLGIPYVGSPPEVIDLALSKSALKDRWIKAGILTPEFIAADMRDGGAALAALAAAPLPCIVKPVDAGNSRGIGKDSVAHDRAELAALAARVGREYPAILVERYLGEFPDFREFTCACIGNGAARRLLPAEIVFAGATERRIVTTEDKDGLKARARRIGDETLAGEVAAVAAGAFEAAGVRDYSRCDLILAGGKLWAIEVNGQPMLPDPWFQACAEFGGLSEPAYVEAIFAAAIARFLPGIERFRPGKEGA
jgi:D-alanine-D-alanine ligase